MYDWSGFYIGANGGWAEPQLLDIQPLVGGSFAEGSNNANGGTIGGQVGYRWQAGTWVFGVEAQGNWADFKGSNVSLFNNAFRNESKTNAFGLFTGQVGYAANNFLLYVKGGAAVTSNNYRSYTIANNALAWFDRQQEPQLGRHHRRRRKIRLRSELVDWSSNTTICSCRTRPFNFTGPNGTFFRQRSHPSGRRSGHRPPELQVRRPGHREVLSQLISRFGAETRKPRALPGAFLLRGAGAVWR